MVHAVSVFLSSSAAPKPSSRPRPFLEQVRRPFFRTPWAASRMFGRTPPPAILQKTTLVVALNIIVVPFAPRRHRASSKPGHGEKKSMFALQSRPMVVMCNVSIGDAGAASHSARRCLAIAPGRTQPAQKGPGGRHARFLQNHPSESPAKPRLRSLGAVVTWLRVA